MKFLKIMFYVLASAIAMLFACFVSMYLGFSAASYYIEESCDNPDAVTWIGGRAFECSPLTARGA